VKNNDKEIQRKKNTSNCFFYIFHLFIIVINFTTKLNIPGPYKNPNDWSLILSDDFSDTQLNLTHWSYNYPSDWPNRGHTHNHQAYMNENNVVIENGLLRLVGENQRDPNAPDPEWGFGKWLTYNYTAGCINTRGKFNFTGGYIEGR